MPVSDEQMETLRELARKAEESSKLARQAILEAHLTRIDILRTLLESERRVQPYRPVLARARARAARRGF